MATFEVAVVGVVTKSRTATLAEVPLESFAYPVTPVVASAAPHPSQVHPGEVLSALVGTYRRPTMVVPVAGGGGPAVDVQVARAVHAELDGPVRDDRAGAGRLCDVDDHGGGCTRRRPVVDREGEAVRRAGSCVRRVCDLGRARPEPAVGSADRPERSSRGWRGDVEAQDVFVVVGPLERDDERLAGDSVGDVVVRDGRRGRQRRRRRCRDRGENHHGQQREQRPSPHAPLRL